MFRLLTLLVVLVSGLITAQYLAKLRPPTVPTGPEGGLILDADVSGTEVYYGNRKLGTVPVSLTVEQLTDLQLPSTDQARIVVERDGWGESWFMGIEDLEEYKLHFLAPDPESYHVTQTPWGARSQIDGGSAHPRRNYFRAELYPRSRSPIQLAITVLDRSPTSTRIRLQATPTGTRRVEGHRPELRLIWGDMSTPWRKRKQHWETLPPNWHQIGPNTQAEITLEIPLSEEEGAVSLFPMLYLYTSKNSAILTESTAIRGDSVWIPER